MRNLILVALVCPMWVNGQVITLGPSVVAPTSVGVTIMNTTDSVRYEWGGHRPTPESLAFVGSAALMPPSSNSTANWAHIRTTVDDPSMLKNFMPSTWAMTDSQFFELQEVEKANVLWLTVDGCDTCDVVRHFPAQAEDGIAVYLTVLPDDLFSDETGIVVAGDGNLIPDSIVQSVHVDQNGHIQFATQSSLPTDTFSLGLGHEFLSHSDVDSVVFTGPFLACPSGFGCDMVGWAVVDFNHSLLTVEIAGEIEVFHYLGHENQTDIMVVLFQPVALAGNVSYVPNFAALDDLNWTDLYPELDRSIVWKPGLISIFHDGVLVYEDRVEVRVTGNSTLYLPAKALRVKFPNANRLHYEPISSRELHHLDLRKFGGGEYNPLADMFGKNLLHQEGVGVPAGKLGTVFLGGEYWGVYNLTERPEKNFIDDHFNNIDNDDVVLYSFNNSVSVLPVDTHRDSVSVRQIRFEQVRDWSYNADKSSPSFRSELASRFNYESLMKVAMISAFAARGDYGSQNWRLFSDLGGRPFYSLGKDFDGAFDCFASRNDVFEQLHDTTNGVAITQKMLFLNVIQNDSVYWDYLNLWGDMVSTTFQANKLLDEWSSLTQGIYAHLDRNHDRWGHLPHTEPDNQEFWLTDNCVQNFLENRTSDILDTLTMMYQLDTTLVSFRVSGVCENTSQSARLSRMVSEDTLWVERISFCQIPVPLVASGSGFLYWTVNQDTVPEASFMREFVSDTTYFITAHFGCMTPDANLAQLSVTEVLPDNGSVVTDPQGQYEDYFEVFNPTSNTVDLFGLYISDKASNLQKYQVSESVLLAPGAYVVFWADKDTQDGVLHTNFKLDKDGEAVYLSDSDGVIDSIVWDFTTPEDVSFGKCLTGGNLLMVPSPAEHNWCELVGADEVLVDPDKQSAFVRFYDLSGREVNIHSGLASGLYTEVHFDRNGHVFLTKKFFSHQKR